MWNSESLPSWMIERLGSDAQVVRIVPEGTWAESLMVTPKLDAPLPVLEDAYEVLGGSVVILREVL